MVKFRRSPETILDSLEEVQKHLASGFSLKECTVRGVDFRAARIEWGRVHIDHTNFLGCRFLPPDEGFLQQLGAFLFPPLPGLPYDPYRRTLYTWQELMEGYHHTHDNSLDHRIYQHFYKTRFNPPVDEALAQRIHDHAIDQALRELLHFDDEGMTQMRCVGIMGGHGTPRTDPYFRKVVETAKLLTENNYFIASGGGPGIMEAANLGAWLAYQPPSAVTQALDILSAAPKDGDPGYIEQARKVLERFPEGNKSLAIPTWFYGHEPSNLFATHIAKYFSNGIREDTLLAVSLHGVIFAPGSAGTTQEIFMDATQNHYGTFNFYSPMVFLSEKRYAIDTLIYPLLRQLSHGTPYHDLVYLAEEADEILAFLKDHHPRPKS